MTIRFDHVAQDLETNLGREWLLTNGLGGYASGTLVGVNTRRYHGLLIAAPEPPAQRTSLLVRLDERIETEVGNTILELSTSEFRDGTMFPDGYEHINAFAIEDGVPTWTLVAGEMLLRRSIWMIPGHNATVIRYKLVVGSSPIDLALRPLCAARQHHGLQRGNASWHYQVEEISGGIKVQATPLSPPLWLRASSGRFLPGGDWYWGYMLRVERERGYDYLEDLYQPGTFHAILRPGDTLTFIASAEDLEKGLPDPDVVLLGLRNTSVRAHARVRPLAATVPEPQAMAVRELTSSLVEAADDFIVRRQAPGARLTPADVSVLAGYPWFTDLSRDAMICVPGLLLGTGKLQEAEGLLRTFAGYLDQGMLPSRFPDSGESADYTTADASLLFFRALRATLNAGAGSDLLRDLYPGLREIVAWHQRGTRFGIKMDEGDGLLYAGEPQTADHSVTSLTWMDARFDDSAYTPRVGKPVEINALWIEALHHMAEWAPLCGDDPAQYQTTAARAQASFARRFWYPAGGYLYDVIDGPDGDDSSLRPNQLFALGSSYDLIPVARTKRALATIKAELLTPYGLRSLAPSDPQYVGQCVGDQGQRDRAYHQGTVWVWPLGLYADTCARLKQPNSPSAALLEPFVAHLREAGVGSISEIFDGDEPHTPRGCIAQAWSVAELLRIAQGLQAQD